MISDQERQTLVWKSISQKEKFFEAVRTLKDQQVEVLSNLEKTGVNDFNTIREGHAVATSNIRE